MFGKSLGEIAQIFAGRAVRDFLTEARRHGDQANAEGMRAEEGLFKHLLHFIA
jgi:hypothetical protein